MKMMGYGLLIPFLLWAPGLLPYCTGEKNLYTVTCALTAADGDSSKTIQVVIEGGVGIQAKVDASFQASVNEHFHGDFSSIESKSLRKCIQKAIDDGDIPYVGQDILYEGGGGLFGHVDFFNGMHWLDSVQRSSTMNEDHWPDEAYQSVVSAMRDNERYHWYGIHPDLTHAVDIPGRDGLVFELYRGQQIAKAWASFKKDMAIEALDPALEKQIVENIEHRALKERLWGAFRPPAPYASSRGAGYEIDSCFTPAKNYTVVVPGTGHPQVTDGDLGVVFPLSTDARHLYHAVELLVPLFGWLNEFFPGRKVDIVVVPADMYNERILGSLLRAVFPEASIVLHGEVHLRDALVADPTKRPHRDWTPVEVNMGNASFLIRSVHVSSEWFPLFQGRVLSAFGVTHKARPRSAQEVQALYIYREQSVRELAWEIIEEMKALFLSAHGVHLQTVVLDSLSLGEQVELFAHTDLVIGVHGNGLTNLIWMPDHGGVFELFPADFHFYFFQMLAEASGHHFCGIQEGNPHPYKRWSRRDDAYGCTRGPPKAIDWELFMAEVDYALKRILTHQGA